LTEIYGQTWHERTSGMAAACSVAKRLVYGVVGLLTVGQVLNMMWARAILRMAQKTKKHAETEPGRAQSPSPKREGRLLAAADGRKKFR
jgi:hypothetical protein